MKEEATLITEVSPEVRSFLKEHIQSVWQLELILQIRSHKDLMTVYDIAKLLYSTPAAIEGTLERFVNLGVISRVEGSPDSYVYSPTSMELTRTIDNAAKCYTARRIDVINLIFSNPQKSPRLSLD